MQLPVWDEHSTLLHEKGTLRSGNSRAASSDVQSLAFFILDDAHFTVDSKARRRAAESMTMLHCTICLNRPAVGALAPFFCNALFGMLHWTRCAWSPLHALTARIRHHAPLCVCAGRIAAGIMAFPMSLHRPVLDASASIGGVSRAVWCT